MAQWNTAFVNNLPDSSFGWVESGTKDADGKTTPRSKRHLPYKDASGKPDLPHVRNALARLDQTQGIPSGVKAKLQKTLENIIAAGDGESTKGHTFRTVRDLGVILAAADSVGTEPEIPTTINVLNTGEWDTPGHGSFSVTASDLDEYIANFDGKVRGDGIAIDVEHQPEKGAVGWFKRLFKKDDNQLWADVDWTDEGKALLASKKYRFFSPEFSPVAVHAENKEKELTNVLEGGGITNRPLFTGLQPVVASRTAKANQGLQKKSEMLTLHIEASDKPNGEPTMDLESLRNKAKDELSTEELAFLKENQSDLTDEERTKFGLAEAGKDDGGSDDESKEGSDKAGADGGSDDSAAAKDSGAGGAAGSGSGSEQAEGDPAGGSDEPTKASRKDKEVTVKASVLEDLKAKAERGDSAATKLERIEAKSHIEGFTISASGKGKLPGGLVDDTTEFYLTLSASQQKAFTGLLDRLPDANKIMASAGQPSSDEEANSQAQITEKAEKLVKASRQEGEKEITLGQALKKVARENPELVEQAEQEANA